MLMAEDEGFRTITDWIVERIHDKETLPGSRNVRRQQRILPSERIPSAGRRLTRHIGQD